MAFDERWKASYWLFFFFFLFSCFSEFCSLVIVLFAAGDQISFVTKQKATTYRWGEGGQGRLLSRVFCLDTAAATIRYDTIRRTVLGKGHGSVPAKAELASNGADREKTYSSK